MDMGETGACCVCGRGLMGKSRDSWSCRSESAEGQVGEGGEIV
jgi:hypothetical protein